MYIISEMSKIYINNLLAYIYFSPSKMKGVDRKLREIYSDI